MFPLGCSLGSVTFFTIICHTYAIPMITVAPAPGAGKAGRPLLPDLAAAAGVGPLGNGALPRDTGAERRRTLI